MDNKKVNNLKSILQDLTKNDIAVAFSGGVDSSLLLVMACEAAKQNGTKVYAVTADTVLHPKTDLEVAKQVLKQTDAEHVILKVDELTVPEIRYNPMNRCYLCKKELISRMLEIVKEKACGCLLEGSNEDDLHVYRPGFQAVKELGVRSPLAECEITKKEVRELAAEYQISVAGRPSSPCLATRLPYDTELDMELLKRIDVSEEKIRMLGYENVRVRIHGDVVRLELDEQSFGQILKERKRILDILKGQGFHYVTLDLEGFRSGSMDL